MKNYLYFGINNKIFHTIQSDMSGDLTIETDKVVGMTNHRTPGTRHGGHTDAIEGAVQLGGADYRKTAARADIKVEIATNSSDFDESGGDNSKTILTNYFGTDYAAGGKLGTRNAEKGRIYELTEAESVTKGTTSNDIVIVHSGTDSAHGIAGKAGDVVICTLTGAAAGDSNGGHDHHQDADRSGLFAIYPEDSFLGAEVVGANQIDIHMKAVEGTWARDIISVYHAGAAGAEKEIMNVITTAPNAGKMYKGLIPVFDGTGNFSRDLLGRPDLLVAGITIALNQ